MEWSSTERPSLLFVRQVFQEEPSGTLEHHVSMDRRDPLELRCQNVEGSRVIGRSLGNILYNTSQYARDRRNDLNPTGRIMFDEFCELMSTHSREVVIVDVLRELFIGPEVGMVGRNHLVSKDLLT